MLQSDKSVAKSYGRKKAGRKWFVFLAPIRRRLQPLLRDASPDADFLPMSHATCLEYMRRGAMSELGLGCVKTLPRGIRWL